MAVRHKEFAPTKTHAVGKDSSTSETIWMVFDESKLEGCLTRGFYMFFTQCFFPLLGTRSY